MNRFFSSYPGTGSCFQIGSNVKSLIFPGRTSNLAEERYFIKKIGDLKIELSGFKKREEKIRDLTGGRLLARNTVLNLIGYGTPLFVALFTIPVLIKGLGTDRFGVLTLVWVLISYIGLFDLGLGRALIKLAAEKLGSDKEAEIPVLIRTCLVVMGAFGIIVGAGTALCLPWLATSGLNIPVDIQRETRDAFFLIACLVPVILISIALRGVLDAYQRFDLTNVVRIPLGVFTFAAPVLILPFSVSLFDIVALLLAGRVVACMVQAFFCFKLVPSLLNGIIFEKQTAKSLLKFGGWMTVTNIISPILVYVDRFFISRMISVAAVTYYATPGEIVTKLTLVSGAMMAVFFPAFSSAYAGDKKRAADIFSTGVKSVFILLFPLCLLLTLLSYDGLHIWLGSAFARESGLVMQFLCPGVFFLCLGQVPYALIQGAGRPDITAKLHLVQTPFYLAGFLILTHYYGIVGASVAWSVRLAVDTSIQFFIAIKMLELRVDYRRWGVLFPATVFLFYLAFAVTGVYQKGLYILLFLPSYLGFVWFYLLTSIEKQVVKTKTGGLYKRICPGRIDPESLENPEKGTDT